jgi:hypothetical protein
MANRHETPQLLHGREDMRYQSLTAMLALATTTAWAQLIATGQTRA